jgi:hypothetical protein
MLPEDLDFLFGTELSAVAALLGLFVVAHYLFPAQEKYLNSNPAKGHFD